MRKLLCLPLIFNLFLSAKAEEFTQSKAMEVFQDTSYLTPHYSEASGLDRELKLGENVIKVDFPDYKRSQGQNLYFERAAKAIDIYLLIPEDKRNEAALVDFVKAINSLSRENGDNDHIFRSTLRRFKSKSGITKTLMEESLNPKSSQR